VKQHLSIALLTYNRSAFLRQSLEALLGQTYGDFELIVLDNHSTDDTAELVLACKDSRLTYVRHAQGGHPGTNHLSAIRMTRGDFILITHDDDIAEPQFVEKQMACMAKYPELLMLATNVSLIGEHGQLLQDRLYPMTEDRIFGAGEYIKAFLDEKLWLPAPTYLHNRAAILEEMEQSLRSTEAPYLPSGDILTTLSLNTKGPIGLLCEPLLRYRQHSGQEARTINQSLPLVQLLHHLIESFHHRPQQRAHLPAIQASYAKFQAQDILFRNSTASTQERLLQDLQSLRQSWKMGVVPEDRAQDAILPVEILFENLGLESTLPQCGLIELEHRQTADGAQTGYRQWLRMLRNRGGLFDDQRDIRSIAIFGSMLTAFLLVREAQSAGIEVRCCLDSSPARIGEQVFGVPVVPLEELRQMNGTIDTVILSSERDHETALRQVLLPHLPFPEFPVMSWKELASRKRPLGSPGGGRPPASARARIQASR